MAGLKIKEDEERKRATTPSGQSLASVANPKTSPAESAGLIEPKKPEIPSEISTLGGSSYYRNLFPEREGLIVKPGAGSSLDGSQRGLVRSANASEQPLVTKSPTASVPLDIETVRANRGLIKSSGPGTTSSLEPDAVLSPEEIARGSYENMADAARRGLPVTFTNRDLAGSPWGPGEASAGGGLNTGDIDIERIVSSVMGDLKPSGTGGLAMPTFSSGSGLFSSLLTIASAIGNAKAARQQEAQRWHRGIEMSQLVSDILEKNRGYGLNLRKQRADETYQGVRGDYERAHAGLARKQTEALDIKPETQMMSEHAKLAGEIYKSAVNNGVEPEQALKQANFFADQYYPELPSVKARNAMAGGGKAPYPEGTKLNGPGGKQYIVKNGVPVLAAQ